MTLLYFAFCPNRLAVSWRAVYWLRMARLLHLICAFDAPHFEFDAWRTTSYRWINNIAQWFTDSAVRRLAQLVFLVCHLASLCPHIVPYKCCLDMV
jgi:hypothetical protein